MMGAEFRRLRRREGASLKDVAGGIVSLGALSKFEGGSADMPINKLVAMLQRMGVSLQEFVSGFDPLVGNRDSLMTVVNALSAQNDVSGLKQLVTRKQARYTRRQTPLDFQQLLIAAGAYFALSQDNRLNATEQLILKDWFGPKVAWSEANVVTFRYACVLLAPTMCAEVANRLFGEIHNMYAVNHSLSIAAWEAVLSADCWLIESGTLALAKQLTKLIQRDVVPANASLVAYRREFITRCLVYRVHPEAAHATGVTGLISFLRMVGSVQLAQSYRKLAQKLCRADLYAEVVPPAPAPDAVSEVHDVY
ncbi:helix-turn-helix domain-containing protein [Lacticaseibacillus thailandensis]|uniref:HTH cro/C1-type domain-containing protein n=1 Tax=Lacticaseibacillus thailandensis DSM 22698 = JCM 13996 TaxID=1423810 RepID=A0A0R2CFG3_9LACO|nr:helix-turn-helix transcriptional regulator [Lacticaseibacillus thailandensis]KRM86726.1 hypothetical protein FD19_GL001777 [Lacticaseibacillus thailandensis DSM 22698 = JCM 13996]